MPRKLPWLSGTPMAATPARLDQPAKRRRVETADSDNVENKPGEATPRRKGKQSALARTERTPSSSPPPQPPAQELMKEGLSADDIWIMVEDEFLSTANLFTQHLHHAEYHRLKRLARAKNSSLNNISRAVDLGTPMDPETRKNIETHNRDELQSRKLPMVPGWDEANARKENGSDDEEAPWMHDSHLSGLMGSGRKTSAHLADLTGARSKTRAAAGYSFARHVSPSKNTAHASKSAMAGLAQEIQQADVTDDEDDLDAPLRRQSIKPASQMPPPPRFRLHERQTVEAQSNRARDPPRTNAATIPRHPSESGSTRPKAVGVPASEVKSRPTSTTLLSPQAQRRASSKAATKVSTADFDWDDDLPKRRPLPEGRTSKLAKRRMAEKEKEKKSAVPFDEIPTFLI